MAMESNKVTSSSPLLAAANENKVKLVKALLALGCDVNARNSYHWTALHFVLFNTKNDNHLDIVELLLSFKPNLDARTTSGNTPLHHLMLNGDRVNTKVVLLLIGQGANLNIGNINGDTPLHLVSVNNNIPMLKLLLSRGAAVDAQNKLGRTPLHSTIARSKNDSRLSVCKWLLANGASVRVKDKNQMNPLELDINHKQKSNPEIKKLLKLFDYDTNLYKPLHFAVKNKNISLIMFLLRHKVDFNVQDNLGWTALHHATHVSQNDSHYKIVKTCLAGKADPRVEDKNGDTSLHFLMCNQNNNFDTAQLLLTHGFEVNRSNKLEESLLHLAAKNNKFSFAKLLLSHGANANARTKDLSNPLHYAVIHSMADSHLRICRLLLAHGTNPYSQNEALNTPLNLAEFHKDRKNQTIIALLKLFEFGAEVNAENYRDQTPLHWAAKYNNLKAMEMMFLHDVDPNKKTNGNTPLHVAAQASKDDSHLEVCKLLLKKNADVNSLTVPLGESPLCLLTKSKVNNKILKLFLKCKADVNIKNADGNTPLHEAVITKNITAIELLLSHGAKVNEKNKKNWAPIHYAISCNEKALNVHRAEVNEPEKEPDDKAKEVSLKIIELLIEYGARVDEKNDWSETALHNAARLNHDTSLELLVSRGADVNAKDDDDFTPIHLAVEHSHDDVNLNECKTLLGKGANVNAKTAFGDTPLHLLGNRGNDEILRLLLSSGADVGMRNDDGDSALHYAAASNNVTAIECLLSSGSKPCEKNNDNWTPLHCAAYRCKNDSHLRACELLLVHKADPNELTVLGFTALYLLTVGEKRNPGVTELFLKHTSSDGRTTEKNRTKEDKNTDADQLVASEETGTDEDNWQSVMVPKDKQNGTKDTSDADDSFRSAEEFEENERTVDNWHSMVVPEDKDDEKSVDDWYNMVVAEEKNNVLDDSSNNNVDSFQSTE